MSPAACTRMDLNGLADFQQFSRLKQATKCQENECGSRISSKGEYELRLHVIVQWVRSLLSNQEQWCVLFCRKCITNSYLLSSFPCRPA